LSHVARPKPDDPKARIKYYEPKPWVNVAYNLIAGYWVLNGIYRVLVGSGVLGSQNFILVLFGVFGALFGVGMLARVEFVRGIVNFVSGINIIVGVTCLGFTVITSPLVGAFALVAIVLQIIDILQSAFLIYLIAETDRRAPNL
jgi:hypothetical protein